MEKIRIGIVGAGFGSYGLAPAFRRDERCEVVGIADSKCWKELVQSESVDAVAIATPPLVQPEIALAAISRGKPVFAEKPIAVSLSDAQVLYKVAEESNLANVVDFMFPELMTFAKAKQLIAEGCIGVPLHIKAEWIFQSADHRNNVTTWRTDVHQGGGALAHFGSHVIYYLQWFFGPIVSVVVRTSKPLDYPHTGDTLATLMLGFENGTTGTLTVSSGSPTAPRHTVEIFGTTGSLLLSNKSKSPTGFRLLEPQGWMYEAEESGVDPRVPAVSRLVRRFIDWILTGQKTSPSFRDGLEVQRVIHSATEAGICRIS